MTTPTGTTSVTQDMVGIVRDCFGGCGDVRTPDVLTAALRQHGHPMWFTNVATNAGITQLEAPGVLLTSIMSRISSQFVQTPDGKWMISIEPADLVFGNDQTVAPLRWTKDGVARVFNVFSQKHGEAVALAETTGVRLTKADFVTMFEDRVWKLFGLDNWGQLWAKLAINPLTGETIKMHVEIHRAISDIDVPREPRRTQTEVAKALGLTRQELRGNLVARGKLKAVDMDDEASKPKRGAPVVLADAKVFALDPANAAITHAEVARMFGCDRGTVGAWRKAMSQDNGCATIILQSIEGPALAKADASIAASEAQEADRAEIVRRLAAFLAEYDRMVAAKQYEVASAMVARCPVA